MIVYRTQQRGQRTITCLREIEDGLRQLEDAGFVRHECAVELLIDYGEFEAAVADILSTDVNQVHPTVEMLRRAGLLVGHLFCSSWEGHADRVASWAMRLKEMLARIAALPLPDVLQIRVPEGYAYYALYPETYLEAARAFFRDYRPREAMCIGIRSIGTSLSAVVAAALEDLGSQVQSYTIRCQGHPYHRQIVLAPELERRVRSAVHTHFLIVDEGPGLSGSSFCSVAQKLVDLGTPEDRIIFFPSRDTEGTDLNSETARRRWRRHRKYVIPFEDFWIKSGRLARLLPGGTFKDLSAGQWRPLFFPDPSQYPAVHPWHERRKYLWLRNPLPPLLLKFEGLGRYGRLIHARVEALADAGFHPPVLGLNHGFLVMKFVRGVPMTGGHLDASFLDQAVRYLAHLHRTPAGDVPAPLEELIQMVTVNITEGLGASWARRFAYVKRPGRADDASASMIDGQMRLHEWLHTKHGYLKTDAVDHALDHFCPGSRDIAWDIAGCLAEWGLPRPERKYLVEQYCSVTHDITLPQRLPFHWIAYLAHRLGYVTLAAQMLGPESPEARRFKTLAAHYNRLLRQSLSRP